MGEREGRKREVGESTAAAAIATSGDWGERAAEFDVRLGHCNSNKRKERE